MGDPRLKDKQERKELLAEFKRRRPAAGVYRIVNVRTGKGLLGSSANLPGVRNRLEFAKTTGSAAALDHRLREDFASFGADAFALEVVDLLEPKEDATDAELRADLEELEKLWREKLDPALLY